MCIKINIREVDKSRIEEQGRNRLKYIRKDQKRVSKWTKGLNNR